MKDKNILQEAERQKLISKMLNRHEYLLLHTELYSNGGRKIEDYKKGNRGFHMGERH